MKLKDVLSCALLLIVGVSSCNQSTGNTDEFVSGKYNFVLDESISPLLDQELYVFQSTYNQAKPDINYQPENKILDLILNKKAGFAVMSRDLNKSEIKLLTGRTLPPKIGKIAFDAVTLIVGKNVSDTSMTVAQIKSLFNADTKSTKNLVFDNPNSSVLNYLKRYFGLANSNQKNIYAVKSSKEVIKYVAEHDNSIGFISYSWLVEPDVDYVNATKNIKIVSIKDENSKVEAKNYFKPSQTTLALKQYPLMRSIYVIDCSGRMGLGAGFSAFMQSEKGQKIVLRSGLLPDSMPRRDVIIKKEL